MANHPNRSKKKMPSETAISLYVEGDSQKAPPQRLMNILFTQALERMLESSACSNGCAKDDMTCDTNFARRVLEISKKTT